MEGGPGDELPELPLEAGPALDVSPELEKELVSRAMDILFKRGLSYERVRVCQRYWEVDDPDPKDNMLYINLFPLRTQEATAAWEPVLAELASMAKSVGFEGRIGMIADGGLGSRRTFPWGKPVPDGVPEWNQLVAKVVGHLAREGLECSQVELLRRGYEWEDAEWTVVVRVNAPSQDVETSLRTKIEEDAGPGLAVEISRYDAALEPYIIPDHLWPSRRRQVSVASCHAGPDGRLATCPTQHGALAFVWMPCGCRSSWSWGNSGWQIATSHLHSL
jgi:hypothetical protein